MRHDTRLGLLLLVSLGLVGARATSAQAATYYLGAFTGSTALDDADCGTGKGTHPSPHPCATLAYWNANRRATALAGCSATAPCTIRLAPGTYTTIPGGTDYNHCVIAQSNTTYEGRLADDSGLPVDFNSIVIDAANAGSHRFTPPCRGMSIIPLNAADAYPDTSVSQLQNFTLRYLTLANAPHDGSEYHSGAALYGDTGSTNILVDHVRFTGNAGTGLMIGEQNWRQYQCATSKVWCSDSCAETPEGGCSNFPSGRCVTGHGTCTLGLDWDCGATVRRTSNVTIQSSQFDHNNAVSNVGGDGGLVVGCVNGFTVTHAATFNNHASGAPCCTAPGGTGCDNAVGLKVVGGINGIIDTVESYDNGESEIEFEAAFRFGVHDIVAERLYMHDACSGVDKRSGLKLTGGHDVTVRNSFIIGSYFYGIEEYNCSHHVTLEHNTVWDTLTDVDYAMILDDSLDWTIKNNTFRNNWSGGGVIALARRPAKDAGTIWDHNILVNANASNPQAFESTYKFKAGCTCTIATQVADCGLGGTCASGICTAGTTTRCSAQGCTGCSGDSDCNTGRVCLGTNGQCYPLKSHGVYALNNYQPTAPAGNVCGSVGTCLPQTGNGLTTFQGAGSGWFGGGEGTGDKWGTAPTFDTTTPTPPFNLRLASTDMIARDAGVAIPGLTTDYDGQARPFGQGYDIGADEYSTAAVGVVGDLDGNSVVDVLDLQRMVNVLLGLETDQAVIARADLDGQNGPTVLDLQLLVNKLLGI